MNLEATTRRFSDGVVDLTEALDKIPLWKRAVIAADMMYATLFLVGAMAARFKRLEGKWWSRLKGEFGR